MQNLEPEATIEVQIIPAWARAEGLSRCFIYRGSSMTPTLHAGHLLYVRPTARDIMPGDVIVFRRSSGDGYIVHRVVSTTNAGLITRGDNNRRTDAPVALGQVIGRVEMLEEEGSPRPVWGGNRGLWSAHIRWGMRRMEGWLRRALRPPYRALRSSSLARRVLGRWLFHRLSVVRLETPDGLLIKFIHNGRTVAHWWPQSNRFECRKPYDLVIPRPDRA
jgi:hypothetical protein